FLPSLFMRERLMKEETIHLKYGDQVINFTLSNFDPQYANNPRYDSISNKELLHNMEVDHYPDGTGKASAPVAVKGKSLEEVRKTLKTYQAPSKIIKERKEAQRISAEIQNFENGTNRSDWQVQSDAAEKISKAEPFDLRKELADPSKKTT